MKTFVIGKTLEEAKSDGRWRDCGYARETKFENLIHTIQGKLGGDTHIPIWNSKYYPEEALQYSFFYMLSRAYSMHREIVINPHDLWYMMLCRVAEIVNADSDTYRHIFTKEKEGKVDIKIPCDEGTINLDLIIAELIKLVPVDVNVFIPKFSNLTKGAATACMGAFCDMVKTYYNYMTFACGIRSVSIGGTKEDWELFRNNFAYIALLLNKADTKNTEWTCQIGLHLDSIIDSLDTGDPTFYKDIFRQQNVGSGSDLNINGWICDFTSTKRGSKLTNFPLMISVVPYKSLTTGKEYVSVYGGFSSWERDGKWETLYSSMGFMKVESKVKKPIVINNEPEIWNEVKNTIWTPNK